MAGLAGGEAGLASRYAAAVRSGALAVGIERTAPARHAEAWRRRCRQAEDERAGARTGEDWALTMRRVDGTWYATAPAGRETDVRAVVQAWRRESGLRIVCGPAPVAAGEEDGAIRVKETEGKRRRVPRVVPTPEGAAKRWRDGWGEEDERGEKRRALGEGAAWAGEVENGDESGAWGGPTEEEEQLEWEMEWEQEGEAFGDG